MTLAYTPFKIFHFSDTLSSMSSDIGTPAAPIHVRIKPINLCNHHCWYCAYKAKDMQLGEDMDQKDQIPENKMMEIVEDLIDMKVKAVTFSGGGEPFLYKPLLKVSKKLIDGGIQIASLTNGSKLEGQLAEYFAYNATWLRISLDAWDDASYTASRGVRGGEFKRLLKRIRDFVNLQGNCILGISLIVDQKNANHVYEIVQLLRESGVHNVKISPCIVSNDGEENNIYHRQIYTSVRSQLDRLKKDYHENDFELFDAYHEFETKFDKNYDWCPFLQALCVIGADLNVYSCQDKAYTDKGMLGSLKEQGFAEFWNDSKSELRAINPSKDCRHHCVANQKNQMLHEYLNTDPVHQVFV